MDFIPNGDTQRKEMLKVIGVKNFEELLDRIGVPRSLRKIAGKKLNNSVLPKNGLSEIELKRYFMKLAEKNKDLDHWTSFLGAGAYEHHIPAALETLISRSEFVTPYTPYQAEASQGTLEALFEFQSLICELTGMDVSNSSMYDGASALAEAAIMAANITGRKEILVSAGLHPAYKKVLETYLRNLNLEIREIEYDVKLGTVDLNWLKVKTNEYTAAVIVQNPNFFGCIENMSRAGEIAHSEGALFIVSALEPLSLAILEAPGKYADIVTGEGQSFGNPLYFGGPHLGFFAAKKRFTPRMPGRIIGRNKDKDGKEVFTLVWQTREQHIRREKATSNICTNNALNAIAATIYLYLLGGEGLKKLAEENLLKAHYAQKMILDNAALEPKFSSPFFNEFTLFCSAEVAKQKLLKDKILTGTAWKDQSLLVAVTETKTKKDIDYFVEKIANFPPYDEGEPEIPYSKIEELIPSRYLRKTPLKIPNLSEPEVVRKFTKLSQKNFCVDTHFYPLGSCTMKYNPKVCEKIAGLAGFKNIHPYQPEETTQGILELCWKMEKALCEITGMDRFSLQPAAGAHGELLGMMIARAYHNERGDTARKKVIIPKSAHGTNPASCARCGYEVVKQESARNEEVELLKENGEIDIRLLKEVMNNEVAAVMLTVPNTLGLFESKITEIADIVHKKGGLLYLDGANMNALLGLARPRDMGFDIVHLNLHKTFGTPHGGGGPGSGPLGVTKELTKFLPVPTIEKTKDGATSLTTSGKYYLCYGRNESIGKIQAFYGNIGVIIKAYAYILALGRSGLRKVAENAIINANYLKERLKDNYQVPYDRACMHEFVLSLKNLEAYNIHVWDVAKRLIDYGIHPPTMRFPQIVEEVLMIEPTETESKETLDRFIEVMIRIYQEIGSQSTSWKVREAPASGRIEEKATTRRNLKREY